MLELVNNKFVLDPNLMTVPQFRAIWDRDESSTKERALAELSYIFNHLNPKSPFNGYPDNVRAEQIVIKLFPEHLRADFRPWEDKDLQQAMHLYKEMLDLSPLRAVLEAGKDALHAITQELRSPKTKTATKLNNLSKLTKAMQDFKAAEELVQEDELKRGRLKGERTVKTRER